MKNLKYIILLIVPCLLLTGCGEEKNNNNKIIENLTIEEGCYRNEKDSEHLICFTEDSSYYEVLNKDDTYYNDPYYRNSPPSEEQTNTYKFEVDDGIFTLSYFDKEDEWLSLVCSTPTNSTIECTKKTTLLGQVEKEEIKYEKISKEFNKEIIESLPIYERNKEFELNFDGTQITCNITRSYSITGFGAGTVITNCLNKYYNDSYTTTQMNSTDKWQIYTKSEFDNAVSQYGKLESLNYLINNYSYNVTANNKTFKYSGSFPINPITSNEKMIVTITK